MAPDIGDDAGHAGLDAGAPHLGLASPPRDIRGVRGRRDARRRPARQQRKPARAPWFSADRRPSGSKLFAEHDGCCKRGWDGRFDLRSDLASSLLDEDVRRVRFRGVSGPVADRSGRRDRGVGRRSPEPLPGLAAGGRRLADCLWRLVASISVLSSVRLVVATAILAGLVVSLFPAPLQSLFPIGRGRRFGDPVLRCYSWAVIDLHTFADLPSAALSVTARAWKN